MAKSLLKIMAEQVFGKSKSRSSNSHNRVLEEAQYKLKQVAFEAKKEFEIAKHRAKSKGWT
jgi:shikimate 5-dehydrogenase